MIEINLLPGAKRKRGGKGFQFALPNVQALAGLAKDPWLIACIVSWALVALLVAPLFLRGRSLLWAILGVAELLMGPRVGRVVGR